MQNVNIVFNANANFGDLIAEVRRVNAELTGLNAQMMGLDAKGRASVLRFNRDFAETLKFSGQFDTSIVTANNNIESFGKNLDAGRLRLKDYYRAWKTSASSAQSEVRKLAEQQVRLERSIVKQTGVDARGRAVMSVFTPKGLDLTKTEVVSSVNQKRVQIFNEMIKKGSTELINWGKNTQWAGRQLTVGLTVPMTIFAGAAATAFKTADEQLTRLAKVYGDVGGATQQQIALIKSQAMDLGKSLAETLGAPLEQTLGLAADIAATGRMGDELIKATAETTRLAVLGEVDRQQALETTLSLQNAFNLSTQELTESINFLNAVENETSTTLQDLTVAIPKAGPVIKSLGGDVKDLALFLSAMVEGGVSAGEAANAIKSGFASLINPTKQTVGVMSDFGIAINNIIESNAGDLVGTILELKGALDGLDPLSKTRALEQLFGKYQVSRITALFDNIGVAGSQTVQVMKLMEASTTDLAATADRELKILTESASGRFNRQIARLKANLADIGEGFIPAFTAALDLVNKLIEGFNNLPGPVKNILNILGGLVAIAGPVIMLAGVFGNFFGYLIKGLGVIRRFITGTKGFQLITTDTIAMKSATEGATTAIYNEAVAMGVLRSAASSLTSQLRTLTAQQNTAASGVVRGPSGLRRRYASGVFKVPGTGSGDTVPAMLTPGESVIPKDMTQRYGPLINAMIKGQIPGYQVGGTIGGSEFSFRSIASRRAVDRLYSQGPSSVMSALQSFGNESEITAGMVRQFLRESTKGLEASHLTLSRTFTELAQSDQQMVLQMLRIPENLRSTLIPEIRVLSNLVMDLPSGVNQALRTGVGAGKVAGSMRAGGLNRAALLGGIGTIGPREQAVLDDIMVSLQTRLRTIDKQNITDQDMAIITREVVDSYRGLDATTDKVTLALNNASTQIGGARLGSSSAALSRLVTGGSLEQRGNKIYYGGSNIIAPVSGRPEGGGFIPQTAKTPGIGRSYVGAQKLGFETMDDYIVSLNQGARARLQSNSPSRVFMNLGDDAASGAAIGFTQGIDDLTPQARTAGRNLASAFVMQPQGSFGLPMLPPGPTSSIGNRKSTLGSGMGRGRSGLMGLGMLAGVGSMGAFAAGQTGLGSALGMIGMIDMLTLLPKIAGSAALKIGGLTTAIGLLAGVIMQAYRNNQSMNASFVNASGVAQEFGISIDNAGDSIVALRENTTEAKDEMDALRESLMQDDEFKKLVDRLSRPTGLQRLFLKTDLSNQEALQEAQIQVQTLISAGYKTEDAKKIMQILLEESGRAGLAIGLDFDMDRTTALSRLIQNFENGEESIKNVAKSANDFLSDMIDSATNAEKVTEALLEVRQVAGINEVLFNRIKSDILQASEGLRDIDPTMYSLVQNARNTSELFLVIKANTLGIASNLVSAARNAGTLGQLVRSFADLPNTVKDILGPRPNAEKSSKNIADNYDSQLKSIDAQIDALKEKERIENNINKLKQLQIDHEKTLQDLSVSLAEALATGNLAEAARVMGDISSEEENYRREYAKTRREIKREDEIARLERLKNSLKDAQDSATKVSQSIANKAQEAYDKASTAITEFIQNNNGIMFKSIDQLKEKIGPELLATIEQSGKNIGTVLGKVQTEINKNFGLSSGLSPRDAARYDELMRLSERGRLQPGQSRELENLQTQLAQQRQPIKLDTQNMQVNAQNVLLSVGSIMTPKVSVVTTTGQLGRANGGYISGPGGPKSDIIPALLSNGEFVINAASVKKYGLDMMHNINNQRFGMGGMAMPKYGMGGYATKYGGGGYAMKYAEGGSVMSSNNVTYNVNMSINNPGASAEEIWSVFQSKMNQEKRRMGNNKKVIY